ncbi:MAG TPA: sigma-70 family RNA polymerase sigma factor [Solirubrobacteraceae bacterium]|nr:sigma-70 family RNA polymerase sigma factor [Solirubrobacteraceae bacterium]
MYLGLIAAIVLPRRVRRGSAPADADGELVARLRAGEEDAFVALVARHNASMLRLASSLVPSRTLAEEVVQDTWVGVLRGLDGFAERSSFRTWLLRILVNRATTTGVRERRTIAVGDAGPVVDRARFDASGAWMSPPQHWVEESEERLLAQGLAGELNAALAALPDRQREVVMLRDVDGLSGQEVCAVLDISDANQRVLLHRGRSQLRQALEDELGGV